MTGWQVFLDSCIGNVPGAGSTVFTVIALAVAGMLIALYRDIYLWSRWKWDGPFFGEGSDKDGPFFEEGGERQVIRRSSPVRLMATAIAGAGTIVFSVLVVFGMTRSLTLSAILLMIAGLVLGYVVGHVAFLAGSSNMLKVGWTPFDVFDSDETPTRRRPSDFVR